MDERSKISELDDSVSHNHDVKEDSSALSHILSRMSINTSDNPSTKTSTNPTSPLSVPDLNRRSSVFEGSPAPKTGSYRRTSAGGSRKSSGTKGTEPEPKSPHPVRKSLGKTRIVSDSKKAQNEAPSASEQDVHAPPLSSIGATHTNCDSRPGTAESIAESYFRKELGRHGTMGAAASDTIVIIHDACYGHRYSRRKSTKQTLNLIVERPERIQAGILGLSSAYVRLGEFHAGGRQALRPSSQATTPTVPFVIRRTTRSVPLDSQVVTNVHGSNWMKDLTTMCNLAESRLLSSEGELTRPEPVDHEKPKQELHSGDLYLCRESLEAFQAALGGVLDGVDEVFKTRTSTGLTSEACKKAFVCIRPPGHHCSADMPSGFCWINNVHVGIEHAAQSHGLTHAAIIDFDLHHGDGSQTITWERNDKAANLPRNTPAAKRTSIGYFSLHDINSYPCEYGDVDKVQNASLCIENAHGQSIWNVHLQPWKTEAEFWELYKNRYVVLLDKARAFLRTQTQRVRAASINGPPKAAIFISAGFDASEWEGEGMQRHKVNVPTEFYARFTSDINKLAEEEGTSVEGRVISVLEGGYSDRALASGVLSHLTGLVGYKLGNITSPSPNQDANGSSAFPSEWWSEETLAALESTVKPKTAHAVLKKPRISEPTFHATPTESFLAKVVDPAKVHRALLPTSVTLTEPAEVGWATAAHELSKLLIPNDRQINSCRHDELSEPRVKKDRQSIMVLPSADTAVDRVQTRGRRPKSTEQLRKSTGRDVALPIRDIPKPSRTSTTSDIGMGSGEAHHITLTDIPQPLPPIQANKIIGSRAPKNKLSTGVDDPIKPLKPSIPSQKVHRTRRVSSLPQELKQNQDVTGAQVPITTERDAIEASGTMRNQQNNDGTSKELQGKDTDIERLTSGVKRITLKMSSKEPTKSKNSTINSSTTLGAEAQRPPNSKTLKISKPKITASRAPKSSSTTNSTSVETSQTMPGSTVAPTDGTAQTLDSGTSLTMAVESSVAPKFEYESPEPASPVATAPETISTYPVSASLVSELKVAQSFSTTELPLINAPTMANEQATTFESRYASIPEGTRPETITIGSQPHDHEIPSAEQKISGPAPESAPDNFIPYMPSSGSGENTKSHVQPAPTELTWLPPNTKTPPVSPTKQKTWDLPVFTANSHIPFGRPTVVGPKDEVGSSTAIGRASGDGNEARSPGKK